jgi:glycosyltransferase involved in cell wall biosynthesis
VYLAKRLSALNEVHIIDAYGYCDLYCEAVRKASIPLHILLPNARHVYIGSKGNTKGRLKSAIKQIPEFLQLRKRLISKVQEIDPDVVWVNNEKSLVFLAGSLRLRKYPLVVYVRGWATPDQMSPLFKWLLRNRVSAVIAHAKASILQMKSQGIPHEKLHFAANTIDIEQTALRAREPVEIPLPATNRQPKILLAAARLTPEKGHLTAVRALARLKKNGFDPLLVLPGKVGTGADETFPRKIEELADELSVRENIHFLGWVENMPGLIRACDIVILPSHTEGFPRIILEAMLLRRPVCAAPVGGIPEAIEHKTTGLLSEVDDERALADCIKMFIKEPSTKEKMVEQAYNLVNEKFRAADHTRTVLKIFESVVTHHKN